MSEQKKAPSRHRVIMEHRESASVTGVLDVVSFDEDCVVADTEQGVIVVKGENLHMSALNLGSGQIELDGTINSIAYEEPGRYVKGKGSFIAKLFR